MEAPYGTFADRKRKALELLAKHYLTWEAQEAKKPEDAKRSVLSSQVAFREKYRELAKNELSNKTSRVHNWEYSLRNDEYRDEMTIGIVNPVTFSKPVNPAIYATKIISYLPELVPVEDYLPEDLRDRNYYIIKVRQARRREIAASAPEPELEAEEIYEVVEETNGYRLNLQQINTKTEVVPIDLATSQHTARLQLNQLTFTASGDRSASLHITNAGDCSVEMQMIVHAHNQPPAKQLGAGAVADDYDETQSLSNVSVSLKRIEASGTLNTIQSSTFQADTPAMIHTSTFAYRTNMWATSQVTLQKNELSKDELYTRIMEKSATPANLRILATRFLGSDYTKMIIGMREPKMLIPCGAAEEIKFIMPTTNNKPGIILYEFELTLKPACDVYVMNGESQVNIKHFVDRTVVTIRCYGVNSQCLQLKKYIDNYEKIGRKYFGKFWSKTLCNGILEEFMDYSVNFSESRAAEKLHIEAHKKTVEKYIEDSVIRCYSYNIVKAKWLVDKSLIKSFLYDMVKDVYGVKMSISDIIGTNEPYTLINFANKTLKSNPILETQEIFDLDDTEFLKQSYYAILKNAFSNLMLSAHYLFENMNLFSKYYLKLLSQVRKRLISLYSDPNGLDNIILNHNQESEYWLNYYAASSSKVACAMFCEFVRHPIVQDLMNKIVKVALNFILKYVVVDELIHEPNFDAEMVKAPFRPGFNQSFTQLIYLAASCGTFEPAFKILDSKDSKIVKELLKIRFLIYEEYAEPYPLCEYLYKAIAKKEEKHSGFQLKFEEIREIGKYLTYKAVSLPNQYLLIYDLSLLESLEDSYRKTMTHRAFFKILFKEASNIGDVADFEQIYLFNSPPDFVTDHYKKHMYDIPTFESVKIEFREFEVVDTKAKKAAVAPLKIKKAETDYLNNDLADQGATLSELYKKYVHAVATSRYKKDPKLVIPSLYLITKFANRCFSDFHEYSEIIGQFPPDKKYTNFVIDKMTLPEVLMDAAFVCLQLSSYPNHPLLCSNYKIPTDKSDFYHKQRRIDSARPKPVIDPNAKVDKTKQKQVTEVVEPTIDLQAYVSQVYYVPLHLCVDMEKVAKPLRTTEYLESARDFNLYEEDEKQDVVLQLPSRRGKKTPPLVIRSRSQMSQSNYLRTTTSQLGETVHVPRTIEQMKHEMRLQAMEQEFNTFIDVIFTEHVKQAVSQHNELLNTYDDDMVTWDKIQLVRRGQLKAEDIGMLDSEVDSYYEPTKPIAETQFTELMAEQRKVEGLLCKQAIVLFDEDYYESALVLFAAGLRKGLRALETEAIKFYRNYYDDFDEARGIIENFIAESLKRLDEPNQKLLFANCQEVCKVFNLTLAQPTPFSQAQSVEFTRYGKFLFRGTEKHHKVMSHYAALVCTGSVYDSSDSFKLGAEVDFVTVEVQALEQFIKLPAKGGKKGAAVQYAAKVQEVKAPAPVVKKEDEEMGEEGQEEDKSIPKLLRKVKTHITAKRDIWSFLFQNAVERAANRFDAVEHVDTLLERAINYVGRSWYEFVEK